MIEANAGLVADDTVAAQLLYRLRLVQDVEVLAAMAGRQRLHDGGFGLGGMPHVADDHVDAAQFHAADQPHRRCAHRPDSPTAGAA